LFVFFFIYFIQHQKKKKKITLEGPLKKSNY
jgi:hypothetical protein